jgi:Thoeris protein ThsB, TIR-like domain
VAQTKRQVFYSFHFDEDVMRVQQIRNMGIVDGDEPASPNEWEQLQRKGGGVEKWIDENMAYRSCVIVLVGKHTADRKWVKYEIKKAWNEKKGLFGIYIHNLKCPRNGLGTRGANPFDQFTFDDGSKLSSVIECYNPKASDAYGDINANLSSWIETAINSRKS